MLHMLCMCTVVGSCHAQSSAVKSSFMMSFREADIKGHDLLRMRHFNNWTEITCGSREQINSINGIFNTHKDLITARGKKKISHLWKISNFKWHTLTWGSNLCSAVSGWVSLKTRMHTRGDAEIHERAHTHTDAHSHALSLCFFVSVSHKETDWYACSHCMSCETGQWTDKLTCPASTGSIRAWTNDSVDVQAGALSGYKVHILLNFKVHQWLRGQTWKKGPYLHKHQPSDCLQQQHSSHGDDVNSWIVPNMRVESHAVARYCFIHRD